MDPNVLAVLIVVIVLAAIFALVYQGKLEFGMEFPFVKVRFQGEGRVPEGLGDGKTVMELEAKEPPAVVQTAIRSTNVTQVGGSFNPPGDPEG